MSFRFEIEARDGKARAGRMVTPHGVIETLRNYLKAMGADLQVNAVFPDGEVEIEQFEEIQAESKSS